MTLQAYLHACLFRLVPGQNDRRAHLIVMASIHRPNIAFANVTLSQTTETTRGDVVPIRSSRAKRTAAMIEAQIAIVDANRS
jgi:hypothetical protein